MMLSRMMVVSLFALSVVSISYAEKTPVSSSYPATQLQQPLVQKININTATTKELSKIKGLTKARIKNLLSYRSKQGDFKSVADLKLVKGFNKIKTIQLEAILNQLTV